MIPTSDKSSKNNNDSDGETSLPVNGQTSASSSSESATDPADHKPKRFRYPKTAKAPSRSRGKQSITITSVPFRGFNDLSSDEDPDDDPDTSEETVSPNNHAERKSTSTRLPPKEGSTNSEVVSEEVVSPNNHTERKNAATHLPPDGDSTNSKASSTKTARPTNLLTKPKFLAKSPATPSAAQQHAHNHTRIDGKKDSAEKNIKNCDDDQPQDNPGWPQAASTTQAILLSTLLISTMTAVYYLCESSEVPLTTITLDCFDSALQYLRDFTTSLQAENTDNASCSAPLRI